MTPPPYEPPLTLRGLGLRLWLGWRWEQWRRPTFCFRCDKPVRPRHFKRCPCVYLVVGER